MEGPTTLDPTAIAALFPTGLRGKRIHAMGAGGSGISAVLRLARARGAEVTGCDMAETTTSRTLNAEGISVVVGHDAVHLQSEAYDLLLVAPAVIYLQPDHPELVAARERGLAVAEWQAFFGYLMRGSVGVSVAGVHGKGTTTGMLSALAIAGGLDPTAEVGATVKDWRANLRVGQGQYFVNEADEWNYNFLHYHPRLVVLTAVEFDHPEFFKDYTEIRDAFVRFLRGMDVSPCAGEAVGPSPAAGPPPIAPTLVLNADDPGCHDVLAQLSQWSGDVCWFSLSDPQATAHAEHVRDDTETSFDLVLRGERLGHVSLETPGTHNIANALAAAAAAGVLGVDPTVLAPALSAFGGLRRRFEIVPAGNVTFVDDYAHHPHAIALTVAAARRRFPGRRLIAVFQPTLYTRLYRFLEPFSRAFDDADEAVIVETQPSRERDTGLVHGRDLVARIAARPAFAPHPERAHYGGTYEETAELVRTLCQPGDVIVVMGSGPVNHVIALAKQPSKVSASAP
jgi:UDP-N-acetylmuramate--alanine ligase